MNYAGWETERQRAALAALLLGGGERDRVQREERRAIPDWAPAGEAEGKAEAASAGSGAERLAPDGEEEASAPGEEARLGTGRKREERGGGLRSPSGAWEEILGMPPLAETLERRSWGMETDADLERPEYRETAGPGEGTGAGGGSGAFSGRAERWGGEESAAGTAQRRPAGEKSGTRSGEAAGAEGGVLQRPGGGETAGESAGTRRGEEQAGWPLRESGTGGERLGQSPTTRSQETGVRAKPWGSGWGTASLRAEGDAKALSRAVERDARRYDGGFYIY